MKEEQRRRDLSLPQEFLDRMKGMLQEEFSDFLGSYEREREQGLRVNSLKVSKEEFCKISPFWLEKIPWAENGFYYLAEERPGKHIYHEAGLYYIQEPSAMAVAEGLKAEPGERVLDLCAAPGGKTTQIAAMLKGKGFLLSNEIHPARAKILAQNVERMGIRNVVVTNETPARLAERFPSYFDRVLVDAPCSGEGMFRKDEAARGEWSLANVKLCAERQKEILERAVLMLKEGGRLVYSTCTFSEQENEMVIEKFLEQHPEFELEKDGFMGSQDLENERLCFTYRLWPQRLRGEGHFIAILKKVSGRARSELGRQKGWKDKKLWQAYEEFKKEWGLRIEDGKYILFGEQLYLLPDDMIDMKGLKVVRPGWHLGTFRKNRLEPSHALAVSLKPDEFENRISFLAGSEQIERYIRGETIEIKAGEQIQKGWCLVEVDGYSLGWGKINQQIIKNHYPKGLRF